MQTFISKRDSICPNFVLLRQTFIYFTGNLVLYAERWFVVRIVSNFTYDNMSILGFQMFVLKL